mgnify:CR=1 FL=1
MDAIRILENCSTARRGFKRGEVVAVGGQDLSKDEAAALLKWQRAEACELPQAVPTQEPTQEPVKPARSRKAESAE